MKKVLAGGVLSLMAVLALARAVRADLAPANAIIIPEVIWADATGGGTWVTALQVTAKVSGSVISAEFHYGTGFRRATGLATSTSEFQTFRFSNVLQAMQAADNHPEDDFVYSGRVGALTLYTTSPSHPIWAQAMTTNGNYGKTMPAFQYGSTENSADVGRWMAIPGLMHNATYRTFIGALNTNSAPMQVYFSVMTPSGTLPYGYTIKTIPSWGFISFNPFDDSGLALTYANSWLRIEPTNAYGGTGQGLFCYGSIANNYTNDTYALIAIPFE